MLIQKLCVCPSCHARLEGDAATLQCTSCRRKFPIVDGVPILVDEPAKYLQAVFKQYEQAIARTEGMNEKLRAAMKDPEVAFRIPLLERVVAANERRVEFFKRQHAPVAKHLGLGTKGRTAPSDGPKFGEVFDARYGPAALNYLRTDWGADPETEAGIERVESVLLRQARQHCDLEKNVVVIGAGAGRYLYDLARIFGSAVGVDMSYPFVNAFGRLAKEDLAASLVELVGPYSKDKMVIEFIARLPPDRSPLDRLVYPVADALALPLESGSVSTVVMTFFADVVPLPKLLAEIKRVLAPGGRVVNYGTLNYHFSNFAWFLAPEEAETVIRENGFEFEEQEWSEMTLLEHPSTYRRTCRVWSYVLRRA